LDRDYDYLEEDLAPLTADTSSMCAEVKAWHKEQCEVILAEMRPPPESTTTPVAHPPAASTRDAPSGEEEEQVEEVFDI
jgi:hypothetical protein